METLVTWWNVPFLAALGFAIIMIAIIGVGGVGGDHDMDHDVSHDISHDTDTDHGMEHDHNTAGSHDLLSFIGIGRVPITIVIMTFCLIWGVSGIISNMIFLGKLSPAVFICISVILAFVCSVFVTRYLSKGLARIFQTETYKGYPIELLLNQDAIAQNHISQTFGSASVYDPYGVLREVDCRVLPGYPTIPASSPITLAEWNPEKRVFYVFSQRELASGKGEAMEKA